MEMDLCRVAPPLDPGDGADSGRAGRGPKNVRERARGLEQSNFEAALEKFRRVQAVRETVAVHYRIGACLEGLGRFKEAVVAYDGAIALGSGGDSNNAESIKAARAKVVDLTRRIPQLTITLSEAPPSDLAVEIDHESVSPSLFRTPIPLDPGPHVITATASGAAPFRADLTLASGARISLAIPLSPPRGRASWSSPRKPEEPVAQPSPPSPSNGRRNRGRRWSWFARRRGGRRSLATRRHLRSSSGVPGWPLSEQPRNGATCHPKSRDQRRRDRCRAGGRGGRRRWGGGLLSFFRG